MADTEKQVVVERDRGSRMGWVVGLIVLVVIVIALIYGLPYLTGGNNSTMNVDVNPVPTTGTGTPSQ